MCITSTEVHFFSLSRRFEYVRADLLVTTKYMQNVTNLQKINIKVFVILSVLLYRLMFGRKFKRVSVLCDDSHPRPAQSYYRGWI